MIPEYTYERAKMLYGLNIPKTELPMDLKIVWCDARNPGDIKNLIQVGVHQHTFFEIHFVLRGEVVYECGNEMMRVTSGNALFIASDILHRYVEKSDDLFKVALAFHMDETGKVYDCLAAKAYGIFRFSEDIIGNISFMLRRAGEKDIFSPYIIGGRITEIIKSCLIDLKSDLPEYREGNNDPGVNAAIEYIDRNKNRNLNCNDVARECCLSPKQLNRIFNTDMGISVYKYIIAERLKFSKKLLAENEQSIKEISFLLGFKDESSFVSFFKRHSGASPGTYRQKNIASASRGQI